MNRAALAALFALLAGTAFGQDYRPLDWTEIEASSPEAESLFPHNVHILEMDLGRPHRVYTAEVDYPGRPLTFAMWVGPGICGMNNCGLKIFDEDGLDLGGAEVCDQPIGIHIDPSNQFVRLCSDTARPIADLMWRNPPQRATDTLNQWQSAETVHLNHNGSVMAVNPAEGTIRYAQVREGLRHLIEDGTILFEGSPWEPGGPFEGTAFTFRSGCAPAPYAVTASYQGYSETLVLSGDAPVRAEGGCDVVGYNSQSSNSVLEFHWGFS